MTAPENNSLSLRIGSKVRVLFAPDATYPVTGTLKGVSDLGMDVLGRRDEESSKKFFIPWSSVLYVVAL